MNLILTVKFLPDQAFMDAITSIHSMADSSVNVSVFSQVSITLLIL